MQKRNVDIEVPVLSRQEQTIYFWREEKEFIEVQYAQVSGFRNLAKKDRVSISDTKSTLWFHIKRDKELIGCCGIYLGKEKCRFKSVWLLPQHRGHGMFTFINNCRTRVAKNFGYNKIEVLTLHPDHYAQRGFNLIKETNNKGVWLMRATL